MQIIKKEVSSHYLFFWRVCLNCIHLFCDDKSRNSVPYYYIGKWYSDNLMADAIYIPGVDSNKCYLHPPGQECIVMNAIYPPWYVSLRLPWDTHTNPDALMPKSNPDA